MWSPCRMVDRHVLGRAPPRRKAAGLSPSRILSIRYRMAVGSGSAGVGRLYTGYRRRKLPHHPGPGMMPDQAGIED
jgi:hypothetical protein